MSVTKEIFDWLTTKAAKENLDLSTERDIFKAESERLASGYDAAQSELAALREELAELRGKLALQDGEIWRDVQGYEGKYLVSNIGRVKALPFDGPGKRNQEVIRWFSTDRCGYHRLNLANKGKKQNFFVHRLVAVAFIPNPENKPFVNHIDGDKFNNHYSNLEWVSSHENNLHVCRVLKKRVKPVMSICLESGTETEYPSFKAAHDLGFNRSSIAKCIAGKLGSHRGFKWIDAQPTESGASE
jgi:hypothetical protein